VIRGRRLLIAVAGVVLIGACGTAEPTINEVDGWPIGGFLMECPPELATDECGRVTPLALAALDDDRAVRSVKVYEEGSYVDDAGEVHLVSRSGGSVYVVVATFTDGTRRAAGVFCFQLQNQDGSLPPCEVVEPPFD
jgi:hypothetical protein